MLIFFLGGRGATGLLVDWFCIPRIPNNRTACHRKKWIKLAWIWCIEASDLLIRYLMVGCIEWNKEISLNLFAKCLHQRANIIVSFKNIPKKNIFFQCILLTYRKRVLIDTLQGAGERRVKAGWRISISIDCAGNLLQLATNYRVAQQTLSYLSTSTCIPVIDYDYPWGCSLKGEVGGEGILTPNSW